jgi:hypothetical protein
MSEHYYKNKNLKVDSIKKKGKTMKIFDIETHR